MFRKTEEKPLERLTEVEERIKVTVQGIVMEMEKAEAVESDSTR
ncbi:hypothetical protein T12_14499 [Trichinella patagoniensis]|uniref:Uncharacterized protein n=1 Tax=Trichinella patagoniensis TaxID=990121 RepID=A0A0V0YQI5_9BILA|nr:hypothetical protein T12_14499 [Trichinella patagoniensis]